MKSMILRLSALINDSTKSFKPQRLLQLTVDKGFSLFILQKKKKTARVLVLLSQAQFQMGKKWLSTTKRCPVLLCTIKRFWSLNVIESSYQNPTKIVLFALGPASKYPTG
jgi:hypothetical protein